MYTMKQTCKKVGRPLLSLLAVAAASLLIYWWHILSPYMHLPAVTDDQLDALDLSGYTKILFSAHPDDELIWGGGHLLDDKYLVVCMTGGNNPCPQQRISICGYRSRRQISDAFLPG